LLKGMMRGKREAISGIGAGMKPGIAGETPAPTEGTMTRDLGREMITVIIAELLHPPSLL